MKAFPNGVTVIGESGMDLRDWFAGQILPTVANFAETSGQTNDPKIVARASYIFADAMMEARKA